LRKKWKQFLLLGAPSLFDILKEFVRGKITDQAYTHLGDLGRWLLAYPAAFFTLDLCLVVTAIIFVTVKQSRVTEKSAIVDEHGVFYERQVVSPNWTKGLIVAAIVCIGVVGYGTYRYYQISIGHFKVSENTNITLPMLPLAPPPPVPLNPPSLLDVFNSDFPDLLKARNDLSIEGTKTSLKQQVYLDFSGKSDFVGFYIPTSSNPISGGDNTIKVCLMLINQVPDAISRLAKNTPMIGGFGEDGNKLEDLTFTGRVLIYHEDLLSITQKAEVINAYKSKNLDVQFRGEDYLAYQLNIWRQRRNSRQSR